jgi:cytochrome P450
VSADPPAASPRYVASDRRRVAHTTARGGYWMLSGSQDVVDAELDWRRFSCADGVFGVEVEDLTRLLGIEEDPPLHATSRRVFNELLSKHNVARCEPRVEARITAALTSIAGRPGADYVIYAIRSDQGFWK